MPNRHIAVALAFAAISASSGCNRAAPAAAGSPVSRLPESSVVYAGPTLGVPRDRVLSALIATPGIGVTWHHGVPAARTRLPNVLVNTAPDVCTVQIVGAPDNIESATAMIALVADEAQATTALRARCTIAFARAFGIHDSDERMARAIETGETATVVYGNAEARYSAAANIGVASIAVRPAGAQ